jgi:probable F420-dependent oxidoreductase
MSELDFGIHYSCQSPEGEWESVYRETIRQAQEAESLGYRTFSVAEHHFLPDGWVPAPFVMLGALAAVTERTNLVTNISILPLHDPIKVAERAAVLDLLSGGTFRLGVAIGWRDKEFAAFGVDKSERVGRVEEGIELVRRLLTERSVTHDGDFYSVEDLTVMPRPVQDSVPIWYGGQSRAAIERSAALADAWSISPIETVGKLSRGIDIYRDELEANGRSLADVHVPLRREAYVAEDDETAWEEVGPSLLYEYEDVYGDYEDIDHSFETTDRESAMEELREHAEDRFIIGSPETAIRELERYRDAVGVEEVLLRMHFPGLDTDRSAKSMRLVAKEVMPHFE